MPVLGVALAALVAVSPQRQAENRAEAERLVSAIVHGDDVESDIAKLKYLGEEQYASGRLARELAGTFDDRLRENLSYAVAALGARSAEPLMLGLVRDPDPVVRMNAAQGLGRIHTPSWRALVPLLKDPSLGVRAEAAKAIGGAHNPKSAPALLKAARAEDEPEVRGEMILAVGDSGDRAAARPLAGFLKSSSEITRLATTRALCRLGAPQGIAEAKKLLASSDKLERKRGVALFEGAPAKVAAPYLQPMLKDPEANIAASAARILYQGGEPVMLDWLVLASFHAIGDAKTPYENELETLQLTDEQRDAILARAGFR